MLSREFEIIERYFTRQTSDPQVLVGVGDDAAIIEPDSALAVATDTLVAGVHFPVGMSAEAIGYRAMAVNLSDMAAIGARPRWFTLALTLEDASDVWLESYAEGLHGLARKYSVELIGGDLTRGPLTMSLQLIGAVDAPRALLRSGASIGDDVYVSGPLGGAAAGLQLLHRGADRSPGEQVLINAFERPVPRVEAGLALRGVASAAIDISDGLVADLGHICRRSRCGAEIDLSLVPKPPSMRAAFSDSEGMRFALYGGDDYELCFTAAPKDAGSVERAMGICGLTAFRIGRIVAGDAVKSADDGAALDSEGGGYSHF